MLRKDNFWQLSDDCRGLSLIAWDTAVTFVKVLAERGLPDPGTWPRDFPARILALSPSPSARGLQISPKSDCRSCQIRPPRADAQWHFDALPIYRWLMLNGRSFFDLRWVAGSAKVTPEAIRCLTTNHREPSKLTPRGPELFAHPVQLLKSVYPCLACFAENIYVKDICLWFADENWTAIQFLSCR